MKIKTSSFCAISQSQDWQTWLRETASDLLNSLQATIDSRKGCRANSDKMIEIYNALYRRGLGQQFEDFISRRFPYIIEGQSRSGHTIQPKTQPVPAAAPSQPPVASPAAMATAYDFERLNKHKVFKQFRPDILSFPQKHIIRGDPRVLLTTVQSFIKDKMGVDYIIVEDHAYIEYFDARYANVVNKIAREARDIYQYRLAHGRRDG